MKRKLLCFALCSALCAPLGGCSSDEKSSDDGSSTGPTSGGYQSGSRLRAVMSKADQAQLFKTWHDTDLDTDCTFVTASDGETRCLPFSFFSSNFGDADCQNRVAVVQMNEELTPYVTAIKGSLTCGEGYDVYEAGDPVPVTMLYYLEGDTCTPGAAVDTATIVALGPAMPPSSFVAKASEASETIDDRLSRRILVAEDGARHVLGFHDATRDVECWLTEPELGETEQACIPSPSAYIEYHFSDDQCAEPLAFFPTYSGSCDSTPQIVMDATGQVTEPTYYEVGAQFTGPIFESLGMCAAAAADNPNLGEYYEIGAPAPMTSFAPLVRIDEGEGRIKLVTVRSSGKLVATQAFYDSEFSDRCFTATTTDGKERCLPYSSYSAYLFADSNCTEALLSVSAGLEQPPNGTIVVANNGAEGSALFRLGDTITPPATVYQRNNGCEPTTPSADATIYATEPVPPTDFVEVTSVTQ